MKQRYYFGLLFLLLSYCQGTGAHAQFNGDWYWVIYKSKNTSFDPYTYFDEKAIERRNRNGLAICDSTDFPVNESYVNNVRQFCDSVSYSSRWLNATAVYIHQPQLEVVSKLPFVLSVVRMHMASSAAATKPTESALDEDHEFTMGKLHLAKAQTLRMGGDIFRKNDIKGKGVRIAILDAGFKGYRDVGSLQHVMDRNGVIAEYDFVKDKNKVDHTHQHGTMVFSNIAGVADTIYLGLAPEAEFLLARTEKILADGLRDEKSWIAALEWADKNGADIINSSLGYTNRLYFQEDMDGKVSLVSKAATLARQKGILVVNSAGNEGDGWWRTIGAPADHPDVLTVGAINPWTNMHTSFSSYGPSADKKLKPNVTAVGHTITHTKSGFNESMGTSFSSPLVAGFAACVLQLNANMSTDELFSTIEQCGDLYPYFDYVHGYGVPVAERAMALVQSNNNLLKDTTFDVDYHAGSGEVTITIRDPYFKKAYLKSQYYYSSGEETTNLADTLERFTYGEVHFDDSKFSTLSNGAEIERAPYIYWHIENSNHWLEVFSVVTVEQKKIRLLNVKTSARPYSIVPEDSYNEDDDDANHSPAEPEVLRIFYSGFVYTIKL